MKAMRPNIGLQPTRLRVEQDRAILKVGCGLIAFPIYYGGAADARALGLPSALTLDAVWRVAMRNV